MFQSAISNAIEKFCEEKNWEDLRELITTPEYASEALVPVAEQGNLEMMEWLVQKGADVHSEGGNALTGASQYGHLDVIKYLVGMGVDPNEQEDQAMCNASERGHLDVVKYFVQECKANVQSCDNWAIGDAIERGDLPMVEYLFENGACLNDAAESICRAFVNRNYNVIEYLMTTCDLLSFVDPHDLQLVMLESMNAFLCMTKTMVEIHHLVPFEPPTLLRHNEFSARILMLVNLLNGTIECETKKWKDDKYYDSNLGMLICSYVD